MSLVPWNQLNPGESPFVFVFEKIGIKLAPDVINFVVITAAASSCNSGLFSTGRMLYALAQFRQAPRIFGQVSRNHVPAAGITFSAILMAIGVLLNYVVPEQVFVWVTSISLVGSLWTWAIIMIAHLGYRKAVRAGQVEERVLPHARRAVHQLDVRRLSGSGRRFPVPGSGDPRGALCRARLVRSVVDWIPDRKVTWSGRSGALNGESPGSGFVRARGMAWRGRPRSGALAGKPAGAFSRDHVGTGSMQAAPWAGEREISTMASVTVDDIRAAAAAIAGFIPGDTVDSVHLPFGSPGLPADAEAGEHASHRLFQGARRAQQAAGAEPGCEAARRGRRLGGKSCPRRRPSRQASRHPVHHRDAADHPVHEGLAHRRIRRAGGAVRRKPQRVSGACRESRGRTRADHGSRLRRRGDHRRSGYRRAGTARGGARSRRHRRADRRRGDHLRHRHRRQGDQTGDPDHRCRGHDVSVDERSAQERHARLRWPHPGGGHRREESRRVDPRDHRQAGGRHHSC